MLRILHGVLVSLILLAAQSASVALPAFRGDPDYLIDTWDTEEGWPGSSAYAMAQTPDGYLWMGSLEGLVQFDGVKFRVFDRSNLPQLPNSAIAALHLDHSSRLWVGTVRGLAVRAGAEWRIVSLPDTNNDRGSHVIRSLADRSSGDLLVTTLDGGVLEYRGEQFQAMPPPPGATNTPYMAFVDDAGNSCVAQH